MTEEQSLLEPKKFDNIGKLTLVAVEINGRFLSPEEIKEGLEAPCTLTGPLPPGF